MKHAFAEGQKGEITIDFASNGEGELELRVRDDGPGLPPDVNFRNSSSLGLRLLNTLVDQLDGYLELSQNGGAEFKITFVPAEA